MLTDTHAHLYYPEIFDRLDDVIRSASESGIGRIIAPAVNLETSLKVLELSKANNEIYCALGIHPCDVMKVKENELEKIESLITNEKVVAIGETGLDYYWDVSSIDVQKEFFRKHIRLASENNLPVIVHTRNSLDDAVSIIREEYDKYPVKAHFHCFSGNREQLKECLDIPGVYISFCGNITYKKSGMDEVIADVPAGRLLSETDSPFLPPVPYRGKANEPAYMVKTIEKIAEVKNIDAGELSEILSVNADEFFRFDKH